MNGGNLRQEYMAAVKNAGLTQFHFHDLCQILMGHKSQTMILW